MGCLYNSKHLTNRILLLQKRAVRVICNQSYLSHTKPLFTKLNILPFNLLYQFYLGVFMYSYYHDLLPSSFKNLFQCNIDVHSYNTRFASDTRAVYGRTVFVNSLFLCQGPLFWNKLPVAIKNCNTLNTFKRSLKAHLIQYI